MNTQALESGRFLCDNLDPVEGPIFEDEPLLGLVGGFQVNDNAILP